MILLTDISRFSLRALCARAKRARDEAFKGFFLTPTPCGRSRSQRSQRGNFSYPDMRDYLYQGKSSAPSAYVLYYICPKGMKCGQNWTFS